jgi:hypothetical protein
MNNKYNYGDLSFAMLAWRYSQAADETGRHTQGTEEEWFRYFRFSQHPLVKLKMMEEGCR